MRRCAKDGYVGSSAICLICGTTADDYPNYDHVPSFNAVECRMCQCSVTYGSFAAKGPPCLCHLSLAAPPPPPPAPPTPALTTSWIRPAGTSQLNAHREWDTGRGQCRFCTSKDPQKDCWHLWADRPDIGATYYYTVYILSAKDQCIECLRQFGPFANSMSPCPGRPAPAPPTPNVAGVQQALSTATNAAMLAHLVAVQPALTQNMASQILDAYLAEVSREPKCECGAAAIGIKPGGAGHAGYCPTRAP